MLLFLLLQCGIAALVGYLVHQHLSTARTRRNLPPGPKPLPIVGNIRDLPPAGVPEFQHWLKHKDLYGPISSVTVLGKTHVLIHDETVARDLLENMAKRTSGRLTSVFATEMYGYGSMLAHKGYNSTFRRDRRLLHQELGTKILAARFNSAQEVETNRQLVRGLREPDKWLERLRKTTAATVLRMTYGYAMEPDNPDVLAGIANDFARESSLAFVPLAWLVDVIPALRYIPDGLPGAGFKRAARDSAKTGRLATHVPYRFVRRQMASSKHRESYVSKFVERCGFKKNKSGGDGGGGGGDLSLGPEDEEAIMSTAMSLMIGSADTTASTLTAFTLAMFMFPQVQRKAQDEIDLVVGTDHLPGFEDRSRLPYVDAVEKEALRWLTITPMGIPHTATEDIEYNGLHIPKGAAISPAIWHFMHDPEVYADPGVFDPDRFFPPRNEPDPSLTIFGYGRRICPGRYFADSGLFLTIARSLAVFRIDKPVDEDGNAIEVNIKPSPGIMNIPGMFRPQIIPRGPRHVDLIKQVEVGVSKEEGDSKLLDMSLFD